MYGESSNLAGRKLDIIWSEVPQTISLRAWLEGVGSIRMLFIRNPGQPSTGRNGGK